MTGVIGPGGTIGILGGGQLGRMLAMAAARLGLRTHIFAPKGDNPAFEVAHAHTEAAYDDLSALDAFAADVDVVTYEFENVPVETARHLAERVPVRPEPRGLEVAQDRLIEKSFVQELGLATPKFAPVDDAAKLGSALAKVGMPALLKTRRLGYDGKGQAILYPGDSAFDAWERLGRVPCILEAFVTFSCEISVIAARGMDGAFVAYDIPRNVHEGGILRRSTVPAGISDAVQRRAVEMARTIAEGLDYVGVLAVEMFVAEVGNGEEALLINEIAPRVHNSGHWTEAACAISQFEQHIRAICGWPLGNPARHSDCVMENILGNEVEHWRAIAGEENAVLHLYGKREAREGRKMGHVTRLKPLSHD